MRSWLAVSALLLVLRVFPAGAEPPAEPLRPAQLRPPVPQWSKGDWWEVQLEQKPLHFTTAPAPTEWLPSFRLCFQVVDAGDTQVHVEVTTIPQNAFQERLVLTYTRQGQLLSAQVV